jgi:hypothetical protein
MSRIQQAKERSKSRLSHLPNAQGLFLVSNEKDSLIENLCQIKDLRERVVAWKTDDLENSLREKTSKYVLGKGANTRD